MSRPLIKLGPADTDAEVDVEITRCLNPDRPKSFFMYAGAGSGKTYSLEIALRKFSEQYGSKFTRNGQRIAIITYTNDARDEIMSRVASRHGESNALFEISTIHSFCWSQIHNFHSDMQKWFLAKIPSELAELEEKQRKGHAGTKATLDRERSIAQKTEMLEWLSKPRDFSYNPNGINIGKASVSHADVLKITADFISAKPSMQAVLINQFPFLLIDESQDTSKVLIDAFFALEKAHQGQFALGLFGDMMQRIYADGKPDLGKEIPKSWSTPLKRMNHRSARRIVDLGNSIRRGADTNNQDQMARDDSSQGHVRLFVVQSENTDRQVIELLVRNKMVTIAKDDDWDGEDVKTLTLEHHMAAARMGFEDIFQALDKSSTLSTGLRDGSLAGVKFFSHLIQPLLDADAHSEKFKLMAHLRESKSPLLSAEVLRDSADLDQPLKRAQDAVAALAQLVSNKQPPTLLDVLQCVSENRLFDIPDSLKPFSTKQEAEENSDEETESTTLTAWRDFLESPYSQIIPYSSYVSNKGEFGTHQGVKGLEFDRVLVVIDDNSARGFLFNYNKVFGAEDLSDRDRKNMSEGRETGVDRTKRLLYVTCTRAEKSLALVVYTSSPDALIAGAIRQGWFEADEIEKL